MRSLVLLLLVHATQAFSGRSQLLSTAHGLRHATASAESGCSLNGIGVRASYCRSDGIDPNCLASAAQPRHLSSGARRHSGATMQYGRDPAWQRDSILLLAYCGVIDLIRAASTGVKADLGFDFLQLNAQIACAVIVAFTWVGVALRTGVLGERRYERARVLLTWALAAPAAAALRLWIFDGALDPQWLDKAAVGSPASVLTDAVATLLIQNAIRLAEEQGYL